MERSGSKESRVGDRTSDRLQNYTVSAIVPRSRMLQKERDDRTDGENDYSDANENDMTP
ncbi:hypothetical protein [Microcoleus asticus]|uniref:hypothetical protein n=1 Tax=Microcoleus asticus TaxID=2815231 RepID=UPI00155815F1|nr:hypothetical protein [Microcoleus asticus]